MSVATREPLFTNFAPVGREIIVDNFAGGGGASTGIEMATGRSVDIAINHDPAAIAMHKANHPDTEHYCENVWDVDPVKAVRGRPVGLAWFSPDCKHFSKAKGGKPVEKKIRGLAWIAVKWAALVGPRVMMLENVEEFKTWGPLIKDENGDWHPDPERKGETFDAFVACLTTGLHPDDEAWEEIRDVMPDDFPFEKLEQGLGYNVDHQELRACDFGAPTIRKRFFMVMRRDGVPITWPEPTHADPESPEVKAGEKKPWRPAAEIIDWSRPCPSIFGRKKPLAENTMQRIGRGMKKFVLENPNPYVRKMNEDGTSTPWIIKVNHQGEAARGQSQRKVAVKANSFHDPLHTVTTKDRFGLVFPFLTKYHGDTTGTEARGQAMDKPLYTLDTSNRFSLVSFIAKHYGGNYTGAGSGMDEPVGTVTTKDHNALASSFMTKFRGTNIGGPVDEPLHTISAGGLHHGEVRAILTRAIVENPNFIHVLEFFRKYVGEDILPLVWINGELWVFTDICMRMLEPAELFRAMGFPEDYEIEVDAYGNKYPKSAQVARCGNAVPPCIPEHLVRENCSELCAVPIGYTSAINLRIEQAKLAI